MEENNKMSLTMDYVLRGGSSWMEKKGTSINSSEAFFCYLKLNHEITILKKSNRMSSNRYMSPMDYVLGGGSSWMRK
jgi:hypothetical protein